MILVTTDGISIWGFMTMGESAFDSDSGEDEIDIDWNGKYTSIPVSKVKYISPLDEDTLSILAGQVVESHVPNDKKSYHNKSSTMSIIKTFYSKDKKHRAHIRRRDDGLIDVISDELEQEYYVDETGETVFLDDYDWQNDGFATCITDSIKNAEDKILRDFNNEYIEAPIVDTFDRVTLKDGRQGTVIDITADGDYIVLFYPNNSAECISEECIFIEEITESHYE